MAATITGIALIAAAVVALIVGATKGFAKQLTGLLKGLVAIVLAVVLTSLIMSSLRNTEIFKNFTTVTTGWFSNGVLTAEVTSQEQLVEVLANGGAWKILAAIAPNLFTAMQNNGCTTLAQLFGAYTANIIVNFLLWLVLFLLLLLVLKLISMLLTKIASLPVLKVLDRVLGGVWAVAITYAVLVGIVLTAAEIIVVKFIPDSVETLTNFMAQSPILTWVNNTNVIGSLIADLLQTELPMIVMA